MSTREVSVRIGNQVCHMSSDDDYLEHICGDFEPHMVNLFRTVAKNQAIVLDIGANIGCTAILFSGICREVHAFEPSPSTFRYLKENVARNAGANVTLHNFGLGAEAAISTITFAANNRSGAFVSDLEKANADHLSEQIQIRTLDDTVSSLGLSGLDFVKIDVEGFEGHVLRGGAMSLQRFQPVVILELNHWCLNAFQRTSVPEFFDQLRSTFPLLYAVDGDRYLDLHSLDESYAVMYHHILHMRFPNIVCAFNEAQLAEFRVNYHHGMEEEAPPPVEVSEEVDELDLATKPDRSIVRRALSRVSGLIHRS